MTGSIGAAFGLLCGGIRPRRRLVLLGTLAGLISHGLADALLWQRINPLVPLYSGQPATLLSHAVFGACLGSMAHMEYTGRKLPTAPQSAPGEPDGIE
jgi:hypothetical protein